MTDKIIRAGAIEIDLTTRDVRRAGVTFRLEPRAAAILGQLVEAKGAVVGRQSLLDACWPDHAGSDEGLSQAVAQLRRAFGEHARAPLLIGTIPKTGYRWLGLAAAPAPVSRYGQWRSAYSRKPQWLSPGAAPMLLMAALIVGPVAGFAYHATDQRSGRSLSLRVVRHTTQGKLVQTLTTNGNEADVKAALDRLKTNR